MFSNASTHQQAFPFLVARSMKIGEMHFSLTQPLFRLPYWLPFLHQWQFTLGNSLILAAICKKTFVRTTFYILLCGLAISDLFTGLIAQPFVVTVNLILLTQPKEVCDNPKFFLAPVATGNGCATYFVSITILFITPISIERWLHMYRRSLVTAHRGYLTVAIVLIDCTNTLRCCTTFWRRKGWNF